MLPNVSGAFWPEKRTFALNAAEKGRRFASIVQVKVSDTGAGIHPEDLPHLFKRFYRSRFAEEVQGVGLGLPLAKAIVEAHRGTIEVDSTLGQGTKFVLNFRTPTKL